MTPDGYTRPLFLRTGGDVEPLFTKEGYMTTRTALEDYLSLDVAHSDRHGREP